MIPADMAGMEFTTRELVNEHQVRRLCLHAYLKHDVELLRRSISVGTREHLLSELY